MDTTTSTLDDFSSTRTGSLRHRDARQQALACIFLWTHCSEVLERNGQVSGPRT
jgi:hypothetical protein